jgi:L1 cell adhesion molecule like protein
MSDDRTTGSRLRVLHTDGDTHLGGEDFDSRMVEFCVEEFHKKHGIQLLEEANASSVNEAKKARNRRLRRLRTACEIAKNDLTAATTTQVDVDDISVGHDLEVTITRAQFERMNEDLFQKAIEIVRKALQEARINKQEITEVLMVGGSSRIPRVRKLLQDFLGMPSLNINQKVDIQEAVAMGAAVQACILNGGSSVGNLPLIKDIQPFSLGIVTVTGKMAVLISRNTYIPCTATESFRTAHENQQKVRIDIYTGEEFLASKNVPLGSFTLTGIPPGAAGVQTIEVKMQIDLSGILNVTATAISTGRSQNLVIEECRGRYTDEEISEMRSALSDSLR